MSPSSSDDLFKTYKQFLNGFRLLRHATTGQKTSEKMAGSGRLTPSQPRRTYQSETQVIKARAKNKKKVWFTVEDIKHFLQSFCFLVPATSPSRGEDVTVDYLNINQQSLPTLFILFLCLFLLYGPFNCILFHKFSQQLPAFPLCSSCLISALLVLSTIYFFMKVSLSPDIILCG